MHGRACAHTREGGRREAGTLGVLARSHARTHARRRTSCTGGACSHANVPGSHTRRGCCSHACTALQGHAATHARAQKRTHTCTHARTRALPQERTFARTHTHTHNGVGCQRGVTPTREGVTSTHRTQITEGERAEGRCAPLSLTEHRIQNQEHRTEKIIMAPHPPVCLERAQPCHALLAGWPPSPQCLMHARPGWGTLRHKSAARRLRGLSGSKNPLRSQGAPPAQAESVHCAFESMR